MTPKIIQMIRSKIRYSLFCWLPISAILFLAAALYAYQLDAESLWIDEAYSIEDAKSLRYSSRPLYFMILHVWMPFGSGESWLRMPALLFGLGSIFLAYRLGNHTAGKRAGLLAALMMSLSPQFINHAQEVRMYTLSNFLGLAGTLALAYALEYKHITCHTIGMWLVARILACLTTPLNLLLFFPDFLFLVWTFRKNRRCLVILAGIVLLSGLIAMPWLSMQAQHAIGFFSDWASGVDKPGLQKIVFRLTNLTVYWQSFSLKSSLNLGFYRLYSLIFLGLLGFVLVTSCREARILRVAAWAFLPVVTMLVISYLFASIWQARYLFFIAPYFLILLAAAFVQLWNRHRKLAIVAALMYLVAVSTGLRHYYAKTYRADWRGVTTMLSTHEEPGDAIALEVSHSRPRAALNYYYSGATPIYVLKDRLQNLPPLASRLWLIYKESSPDKAEQFRADIQHRFQIQEQWTFANDIGWQSPMYVFLIDPNI